MANETLKMKLTGVSPLMMHNGQLADPTNKFTKAIKVVTARRKKTDEDYLELKRVEWLGAARTMQNHLRCLSMLVAKLEEEE